MFLVFLGSLFQGENPPVSILRRYVLVAFLEFAPAILLCLFRHRLRFRLGALLDVLATKHEAVPPCFASSVNAHAFSFRGFESVFSFFGLPPSFPYSRMRFRNSFLPHFF